MKKVENIIAHVLTALVSPIFLVAIVCVGIDAIRTNWWTKHG